MLKVKEISELLGLKKNTLLYHIREKEEVKQLFNGGLNGSAYILDDNKLSSLLEILLRDSIISEEVFNKCLNTLKKELKEIEQIGEVDVNKSIVNKEIEQELKYLKELLKTVKEENQTLKEELREKNGQINSLLEENRINQQLMIQYQVERNKLIEQNSETEQEDSKEIVDESKKLRWWQKLFK